MKGIIFDLDGTLVDNMIVHHRAWQRKLRELGLDYSLERVQQEIHGINMEILVRLFGNKYTEAERAQIAWDKEATYREIYAPEIQPIPGLMDFLREAKHLGVPMAIATAGPPENCFFALDALNIRDFFGHIVHSAMVQRGKPDPEAFQQAAAGIGVPVEACMVFEDSVTGARAAANAGSPAIVVTTTHKEEEFAAFGHIQAFIADYQKLQLTRVAADEFEIAMR